MSRRRARGRDVNGILLLDKAAGATSNSVLQQVKRLMGANKAGHTGSLDPIATGVLPICLGEATKLSGYLLDADKGYDVTIRLGVKTSTGDIEGDVLAEHSVPKVSDEYLSEVLERFTGDIYQIPPMYSALKKEGQPLYKLARKGIEVEREARPVTIYELVLRGRTEDTLDLSVLCSKGTYIRTLAEDIGEVLGCGAHVAVLRRTKAGTFTLSDTHTMGELELLKAESFSGLDAAMLPLDAAISDWNKVNLTADMAYYIVRGQAVQVPKAPTQGMVSLYQGDDEFLGIGYILDDGRVAPKRLVAESK